MKNFKNTLYWAFRHRVWKRAKSISSAVQKAEEAEAKKRNKKLNDLNSLCQCLNSYTPCFKYYISLWDDDDDIFRNIMSRKVFADDILHDFFTELKNGNRPDVSFYEKISQAQNNMWQALLQNNRQMFRKSLADGANLKRKFAIDQGYLQYESWWPNFIIGDLQKHIVSCESKKDRETLLERFNNFIN